MCQEGGVQKIISRLTKSITCSFRDAQYSAGLLSKTYDFVTNRWSTAMVKNFSSGVGQMSEGIDEQFDRRMHTHHRHA